MECFTLSQRQIHSGGLPKPGPQCACQAIGWASDADSKKELGAVCRLLKGFFDVTGLLVGELGGNRGNAQSCQPSPRTLHVARGGKQCFTSHRIGLQITMPGFAGLMLEITCPLQMLVGAVPCLICTRCWACVLVWC